MGQEKVAIRDKKTYMGLELGFPTWWDADVSLLCDNVRMDFRIRNTMPMNREKQEQQAREASVHR